MLNDELKNTIQSAYTEYLNARGLTARPGQKQMLAQVARTFGSIELDDEGKRTEDAAIAVIEAGTGTGKTVGYLLSALPVAQYLKKKLVIATATVALQEQVVQKDLPEIEKHTSLKFKAVLAKGRGRYLCTQKLEQVIQFYSGTIQTLSLFEEAMDADEATLNLYNEMMTAFGSGEWSGDRDQWPSQLEDPVWQSVTSSHRECLNRRCPYFDSCPFYEARNELEHADLVIANHDLVLADLSLGGGTILPAPEDALYIFDEGHHLAEKALMHFAHSLPVRYVMNQLEQFRKQLPKIRLELGYADGVEAILGQVEPLMKDSHEQLSFAWTALQPWFQRMTSDDPKLTLLQPEQQLPIAEILHPCQNPLSALMSSLSALDEQARKHLSATSDISEKERIQNALPVIGRWLSRIEPARDLVNAWLAEDAPLAPPTARWLERSDTAESHELSLHTSPVSANNVLRHYLWQRACGALLTSATLTVARKFDRLKAQTGVPDSADTLVVPSPFNYRERVQAFVPKSAVDGAQKDAHSASIAELVQSKLPAETGNLVLFSSRAQMNDVFDLLSGDWQSRVTKQDDLPKNALIQHHKDRLEEGLGSTLFGLASLAEGVDLPGHYLTHLVIAKIPFGVPDDPVSATLSVWLESRGQNPFQAITLPNAAIRLVQACGRLIRHEADSGKVWIMDRRIIERRYGKTLIQSLPDFHWQFNGD